MSSTPSNSRRGYISALVLILLIAFGTVIVSNISSLATDSLARLEWDRMRQVAAEAEGLEVIVKEAVLAQLETALSSSAKTFEQDLNDRLTALYGSSEVSYSVMMESLPTLPTHVFFPAASPAAADQASSMGFGSTSLRNILALGPATDLGTVQVDFSRSLSDRIGTMTRTVRVAARIYSVPLTNFDGVAYARPSDSGTTTIRAPLASTAMLLHQDLTAFEASGGRLWLVSSLDPRVDTTAIGHLRDPSGNLPYYYRNHVSVSWNLAKYLWRQDYLNTLHSAAGVSGTVDFGRPDPELTGVTFDLEENRLEIALSEVDVPIVQVIDAGGARTVRLVDGGGNRTTPIYLVLDNRSVWHPPLARTRLELDLRGARPVIIVGFGVEVDHANDADSVLFGSLLLDPNSTVNYSGSGGSLQILGSFFWDGTQDVFGSSQNFRLAGSREERIAAKMALAPIAPRVVVVGTTHRVL